jgi:hypothetical protein
MRTRLISYAMPVALWQTAPADSTLLGYVARMPKLLLGWGLALKDKLVDETGEICVFMQSRRKAHLAS